MKHVSEIALGCEYKIVEVGQAKIVGSYGSESILVSDGNLFVEDCLTVYRGCHVGSL